MPISKEFTVNMQDRPGTLGRFGQALADNGVNIVGFQSFPFEGKSTVRFVVDNPTSAKRVMDQQGETYTEADVAHVKLQNRPGELAYAASQLGEAEINIDYAYGGVEPGTNAPLLFFGVANAAAAAAILDRAVEKAA